MFENPQRREPGAAPTAEPFDPTKPVEAWATVPVQPVQVQRVPANRRLGLRWVVTALSFVLVATVSFAGWRLLVAAQPNTSDLANWAPDSTLAWFEANLDAPGDQGQKLRAVLAHFPGFGDASQADARLDDLYDSLIRKLTKNTQTYTADIDPWSDGTIAVAVTQLPNLEAMTTSARLAHSPEGTLLLAGVKDAAVARAWVERSLGEAGTAYATSTVGDAELYTTTGKVTTTSVAVLPGLLAVGDATSVKALVDRHGADGLSSVPAFVSAAKASANPNLASWYLDYGRYTDWLMSQSRKPTVGGVCATALGATPEWIGGTLTAESNTFVTRNTSPHVDRGVVTSNSTSALLAHVPGTALAVIDEHTFGDTLRAGIERLKTCAGSDSSTWSELDSAVKALGGWDGLTGWLGETAIVVDRDGDNPTGGLLVVPTSKDAGDKFAAQLKALIALAGGVAANELSYHGVTITALGDPNGATTDPVIAYAFTETFAVVGPEAWVKKVIDTDSAASLASNPRFTAALGHVSAEHSALVYADIAGLRGLIEARLPSKATDSYGKKIQPWLAPLDAFVMTSTVGSDLDHMDAAITVK